MAKDELPTSADTEPEATAEPKATAEPEAAAEPADGVDAAEAAADELPEDEGEGELEGEGEGDDEAVEAEPAGDPAPSSPTPEPASAPRGGASRLWWALPILLVTELWVYGHNGRVEICVGKEGETDFSLVGQERTDDNRWKFPRCETRENLGLRSQYDAKLEEATKAACRGATIFRHQGEAKACVAGEQGWQHRVEGHFVPPWDPAFYRHLFWFLF